VYFDTGLGVRHKFGEGCPPVATLGSFFSESRPFVARISKRLTLYVTTEREKWIVQRREGVVKCLRPLASSLVNMTTRVKDNLRCS